jgi:ribosomal protein S18 acetylase RimI-like enzyme
MQISVYRGFDAVPDTVRLGLSHPSQPNFFLSLDWFEMLYQTSLRDQMQPRIYVAQDADGQTLGALYTGVAPGAARSLASLTNFYVLEYQPVLVPTASDHAAQVIDALVAHLAAERPRWSAIRLRLLKDSGAERDTLIDALHRHGFSTHLFFQYENWCMDVAGQPFATYYAGRPSQLRNTIERRAKKLAKAHPMRMQVLREPGEELDAAIASFTKVYESSWKQPEPYPDFMPAFMRLAARLGVLRLGLLEVDGVPAAAQLWVTAGGRAVIYKLAYDERFRDFGVGSILSRELFRVALDEDAVREIDYGVGSDAYKRDWMSFARRLHGVEAFNRRTLAGRALAAAEAAKALLREWRARRAPTAARA